MHVALAYLFAGFLFGMCLCVFIWEAGERAVRRERIERARRRDHSKVPSIRQAVEGT